eukprot:15067748-Alexandrium_andersonii.AAC.1
MPGDVVREPHDLHNSFRAEAATSLVDIIGELGRIIAEREVHKQKHGVNSRNGDGASFYEKVWWKWLEASYLKLFKA